MSTTKWPFWGEKEIPVNVYQSIYTRTNVEDWFEIIIGIANQINSILTDKKLNLLDIGCGEGHTTKQILDRVVQNYECDLLEPNKKALLGAKDFLSLENSVGDIFNIGIDGFDTMKKYDSIFTSHTNYYWANNKEKFNLLLEKLLRLLDESGKLMILTLPENSAHYKVMLNEIYPSFNYAEYIADFYTKMGLKPEVVEFAMRMYVGDILSTNKFFDLKNFYKFIHNTDTLPTDDEALRFLEKIKENEKDGYLDFKDYLIIVDKK